MLKEKSAKEYIADNDFEGAKARLEKTTIRWELYWYEVCYEIATNDKRWFSLYNFYLIANGIPGNPPPVPTSSRVVPG